MKFREQLRSARQRADLTLRQVGEKIGVAQQTVHAWESGIAYPNEVHLDEVCVLLGLDYYATEALINGECTESGHIRRAKWRC